MKRVSLAFDRVLSWFPVSSRIPTLAGVIVFVVAIGTTNLALLLEGRETDRLTERLARVYLDGLAAAITDPAQRGDWSEVDRRLRAAFREQAGIAERVLVVVDPSGRSLASAATAFPLALPPDHFRVGPPVYSLSAQGDIAWVSRALTSPDNLRVIAALDLTPVLTARRNSLFAIAVLDFVLAILAAVLASYVMGRANRPIAVLADLMEDAARGVRRRVPVSLVSSIDRGVANVFTAYNAMIDGLVERERLRAEFAERSQTSALGRLAATMAHEVRNPLAGLSTAVATLRKFGGDPAARTESLDFLSRGIEQLESITTSMLNFHRPEEERRLTRADFEDMKILVEPIAKRKELSLDWRLDLPDSFSVAATGVRQVLLNLLLNACSASARGGTVVLSSHMERGFLVFVVSDSGVGMTPERIAQLTGHSNTFSERLGLDTVVSLLGSLEAVASVESTPGGGTSIRIEIPLAET